MKRVITQNFIILLCLLLTLSGCSTPTVQEDILSLKKTEAGRTQITILVKYAFSINNFEKIVEEKFPNIDIVQVGNYTRDMGKDEYYRRLEHDDLTDIVMTWPLDVGQEFWEDRLLDLSGMEFTNNYNLSMLNEMAKDGKLYYLPGPAQVRGIVYNKTLFEENGWTVPTNYNEFITLCKTIENSGIRSIQLGFKNSEVLSTAFFGYNFANYFSKPKVIEWLNKYNSLQEGSFSELRPALETFQEMVDYGIWKEEDLSISYSDRENMFFNRKAAMIEDSVLLSRMGFSQTGTKDEFALMPFFSPGEDSDWARLYMVCYIGLNKDLANSENKKKYDLVMDIMNYISTPEGQEVLASDTGAMFSSLIGTSMQDIPEIVDLKNTLEYGRYSIFPQLKNASNALHVGLAKLIQGKATIDEVIQMIDDENKSEILVTQAEVFGTATENFTLLQTGNYITDVMKDYAETDFALFLDNGLDGTFNGKGLSGKIYEGDITSTDLQVILPDLKQQEKGTLWKISVTGKDLLQILEHSLSVYNDQLGWFYYFSGLTMEYDITAKQGERIQKIKTSDHKEIDENKLYTIAVMDETIDKKYIQTLEETDITIYSILANAIKEAKSISPSNDNRFTFPK